MSDTSPRILVTGASGRLGRLVVQDLLRRVPPTQVVAAVRRPDGRLDALDVEVRLGDYDQPDTPDAIFAGIGRALLVSSSAHGRRVAQHVNVVGAAKRAKVALLAYTSVLHADSSALGVAEDHRATEAALRTSGIPFVLLRNGWYTENYAAALPSAVASGTLIGCAGSGRIASAARADYAAAAVAVLAHPAQLAVKLTNWRAMPPLPWPNWRQRRPGSQTGPSLISICHRTSTLLRW